MKNTDFAKQVVFTCSAVPLVMMLVDVQTGRAGPDVRAYMIHATGVTALVFLLLSLSVTPLRKITGKNYWSLFRRMLGLYAFLYACVHFLCYLKYDRRWDLRSAYEDFANPYRPFVFFGMVALLLMIPLALTSTAGWVKRLGAWQWKRIHRLAYISAISAAIHFFLFPKITMLASLPGIFAVILGFLLGFRLVTAIKQRVASRPEPRDFPLDFFRENRR